MYKIKKCYIFYYVSIIQLYYYKKYYKFYNYNLCHILIHIEALMHQELRLAVGFLLHKCRANKSFWA